VSADELNLCRMAQWKRWDVPASFQHTCGLSTKATDVIRQLWAADLKVRVSNQAAGIKSNKRFPFGGAICLPAIGGF
jgi:hypothetical protein